MDEIKPINVEVYAISISDTLGYLGQQAAAPAANNSRGLIEQKHTRTPLDGRNLLDDPYWRHPDGHVHSSSPARLSPAAWCSLAFCSRRSRVSRGRQRQPNDAVVWVNAVPKAGTGGDVVLPLVHRDSGNTPSPE